MSSSTIAATPEQLRQTAAKFLAKAESIQTDAEELEEMGNQLLEDWKGQTSEAFMKRFEETMKPNMKAITEELDEIHKGIDTHADKVEELDTSGAKAW